MSPKLSSLLSLTRTIGAIGLGCYLALSPISAHAQDADATVPDANCTMDPGDKWERPASITAGSRHKHPVIKDGKVIRQCTDTKNFRPLEVWPTVSTEKIWVVTNVYHNKKFWTAYIPVSDDAIEKITVYILHQREFIVIGGHSEIEIKLKQPALLVAQEGSDRTQINDFIYSLETIYPPGEKPDTLAEFPPNVPIIGRLASYSQRASEDGPGFFLYERFPMKESFNNTVPGFKSQFLKTMLKFSSDEGSRQFYQVLKRNCASTIVAIVDKAFAPLQQEIANGQLKPFASVYKAELPFDPVLGPARDALVARGLIDPVGFYAVPPTTAKPTTSPTSSSSN